MRVLAAVINPADLNIIEGRYAFQPNLPCIPGNEGVAVVEEVGYAVTNLVVGDRVLLPPGFGSWREGGVWAARDLVKVPETISIEQAAMLRVNPGTALRLLRDFGSLKQGSWVLQNAANSAVGRAVIQLARHFGFRTVNLVRRTDIVDELYASGADVVLPDSDEGLARLPQYTNREPIHLALNAVGGESALRLANTLAPGGTIVTYGAMAKQPLRIPNGLLIFQDLQWRGFWLTRWSQQASPEQKAAMAQQLVELAQIGVIHSTSECTYPLVSAAEALRHAMQSGRRGKILLSPDAPPPSVTA